MLSSTRITVLTPTFMFIIHFKLIFTWYMLIVKNSTNLSSSFYCFKDYHLVQHQLLKRLIQLIPLSLCDNEWPMYM